MQVVFTMGEVYMRCSLWVKYVLYGWSIYILCSLWVKYICGVLYGWSIYILCSLCMGEVYMWCSLWVKYTNVMFPMGEVYKCGVPYYGWSIQMWCSLLRVKDMFTMGEVYICSLWVICCVFYGGSIYINKNYIYIYMSEVYIYIYIYIYIYVVFTIGEEYVFSTGEVHICGGWSIIYIWCSLWVKYIFMCGVP